MVEWLAALQPPLIGVVLLWSGGLKTAGRYAASSARRSALADLVGGGWAVPAYRAVGVVELTLAAALLLPPAHRGETIAATALTAGFLGYLAYARRAAPGSSCGCLDTGHTPVTWRGFGRAGLLLAASGLASYATTAWTAALTARPLPAAGVLAGAAALLVVLSPEWDHRWLLPLRRLWFRLRRPRTAAATVPVEASLRQLHASAAYREVHPLLRSGLREIREEGDARELCYAAEYDGRLATAVFAVPLRRSAPDAVTVTLVAQSSQVTLLVAGCVATPR